jgi:hypothetical protein
LLAKGAFLLAVLGSALGGPLTLITVLPARAEGACTTWSTYEEQGTNGSHLTAVACSSTADDSSVVGLQCIGKRPVLRYYPGNFAQQRLTRRARIDVTFAVGDDGYVKSMLYDPVDGVFSATISKTDPVLGLLQSGGPLDLGTDILGTHRFRLIGSNAAVAVVMQGCGVKDYLAPPPPLPAPDPRPDEDN